jgi:1-acyl-sn-glycerol-3-phosphate acyltransferase
MNALKQAFRILQAGHAILMAPEGTRTKGGGMRPAHEGAALIAERTGAPILPIAEWGGTAWMGNVKRLKRTRIHMHVAPPLVVRPLERKPTRQELEAMMREIMYTIAAMLPPEFRGVYSDVENFERHYLVPFDGQVIPRARHERVPKAREMQDLGRLVK